MSDQILNWVQPEEGVICTYNIEITVENINKKDLTFKSKKNTITGGALTSPVSFNKWNKNNGIELQFPDDAPAGAEISLTFSISNASKGYTFTSNALTLNSSCGATIDQSIPSITYANEKEASEELTIRVQSKKSVVYSWDPLIKPPKRPPSNIASGECMTKSNETQSA